MEKSLLEEIIEFLVAKGHPILAEELQKLHPTNPVQAAVVSLVRNAWASGGLEGLLKLKEKIKKLSAGEKPDIDVTNLRSASGELAVLEKMEANEKSAAYDEAEKIIDAIKPFIVALLPK